MSKIYCGSKDIPKGKGIEKGSMKECAKKGQVRMYGLFKVDPVIAKPRQPTSTEKKMTKVDVRALLVKLKARFERLKEEISDEENNKNDKKKIKELKKDMEDTKKNYSNTVLLFKKMKDDDKMIIKK